MKIKTARFWIWHREGFVRLALQHNQEITFYHGGPHDEGFSHTQERYSRVGDTLHYELHEWGRDCDGAYSNVFEYRCPITMIAANNDGGYDGKAPPRPVWVDVGSDQYDEYAEAAGY